MPDNRFSATPAERMNRIYRRQRYIYDATRRFVLPGRDALLCELDIREGARVLEVGCGTARNLIRLARRHPAAAFYGIDASKLMLATARAKVQRAGLAERITLKHGLAERLDAAAVFGLDGPFDVIFFSYSLTMIPACVEAVDAALQNLRPGRTMCVVDFRDPTNRPRWLRGLLKRWLAMFSVAHRPEVHEHLRRLADRGAGSLTVRPVAWGFAFIACFTKA